MINKFPTSVELHKIKFVEPEPDRGAELLRFWVLCVPLAGLISLVLCVIMGPEVFLPAWAMLTLVVWVVVEANEKPKQSS